MAQVRPNAAIFSRIVVLPPAGPMPGRNHVRVTTTAMKPRIVSRPGNRPAMNRSPIEVWVNTP